jgi:hypothetical protein
MNPESQLKVKTLRSPEEIRWVRGFWNEVVLKNSGAIEQLDLTSSYEWVDSLWESHLKTQLPTVLVLSDGSGITGLMPLRTFRRSIRGISCRSFEPVSELYSGRTGFLFRNSRPDLLVAILNGLRNELGEWDTFSATVVQGSAQESLLLDAARLGNWQRLVLRRASSPYIEFQESWEAHFAALPKKLRSTMRNGEKRLRERGELSYREFVMPQSVSERNGHRF